MNLDITESQRQYLLNLIEKDQRPYDPYELDGKNDPKTRLMTDPIITCQEKKDLMNKIENLKSKEITV